VSNQKYGPQTAEIEAKRELWLEALDDAGIASQDTEAVWNAIQEAVDNELLDLLVGDFSTQGQLRALYRTWELAMDSQSNKAPQPPAEPTNDETVSSLRQEIAFRDATIQGGIAALAIKNEQLAIAKRKIRRWKKKAKKAKAELAKFQLCEDSNGCYDDCGRVHVYDAEEPNFSYAHNCEMPRSVYHKEGE
jgi:post-segregation antitoxin (ccd killing protein)